MKRPFYVLSSGALVAALALASAQAVGAAGQAPSPASTSPASQRAVVDQYCVTCHNQRLKTGGFTLDNVDMSSVGSHPEVWEKVARKLRAGLMPPAGSRRPDPATTDGLRTWLETELDRAAAASPNPGRTESLHRLNRAEYRNAIRDLLALDMDVAALLPVDDSSHGFDNQAGVQRMSPTLMERYLSVGQKVSRVAVGTRASFPDVAVFRAADQARQDDTLDGLPFGTRGGLSAQHVFQTDGTYDVRVRLARASNSSEDVPKYDQTQQLEVSVDGEPIKVFTLVPPAEEKEKVDRRLLDANWVVRIPVKAGPREITATFLNRTPALLEIPVRPYERPYPDGGGAYTTRRGAYLDSIEITGPFDQTATGDTPSRKKIFACRPANAAEETPCARTIMTALARRAYRRPVTAADVDPLLGFYAKARTTGNFDDGIADALRALLVNPQFLFRIEREPAAVAPGVPYKVSDLELASRLSFFLWSSIPDDQLLNAAVGGTLRNPGVLDKQIVRMLADPRSESLVKNFASQWLFLRNVPGLKPDRNKDPDFDEDLRRAFQRETEMFFESIMRENRSVLDLLTADYTFVNERLAWQYGLANVEGPHFRRVKLPEGGRRGLLGHGSILAVTSYAHRTSPVVRGRWILENLLGTPPPPPPPDVPGLNETNPPGKILTIRERLAAHRNNPVCSSCHSMMDPLGFALENFDFVGKWRTMDESATPIDASGTLPNGVKFDGVAGLRQALVSRPEQFVTTITEKMMTYAMGRGVEYYDAPAVRRILRAAGPDYKFTSLVRGIVASQPFQMRRAGTEKD